jgi:hypothetical protein
VFKSQHPDVLAVWQEFEAASKAFHEFADDFASRYAVDGREVMVRESGWFGRVVSGLGINDADNDRHAPRSRPELPGLRLGAKEGYWVPDKRTAEGRALSKEFKEQRAKKPSYPGMPDEVWADREDGRSLIFWPGSDMADGWVWVTWGCGADRLIEGRGDSGSSRRDFDPVDLTIWTHVRLSEYHAMREAAEEPA